MQSNTLESTSYIPSCAGLTAQEIFHQTFDHHSYGRILSYFLKKLLKPGQSLPRSGQYEIIGPRGGKTGEEITGVKGKTLPPTPKVGLSYRLADPDETSMNNLDNMKFDELKGQAEAFYETIGEVHCPYFNEKIALNAKGLEHLKFHSKNHARPQADQYTRLKLLHLAPEVLKLSRTIQGLSHTKNFEYMRSNARTELVLKSVCYYEFIAIPFWKMDKEKRQRKMSSGNLETA